MRQVSAKSMRNEDWFTETCVLSYNNLGEAIPQLFRYNVPYLSAYQQ